MITNMRKKKENLTRLVKLDPAAKATDIKNAWACECCCSLLRKHKFDVYDSTNYAYSNVRHTFYMARVNFCMKIYGIVGTLTYV